MPVEFSSCSDDELDRQLKKNQKQHRREIRRENRNIVKEEQAPRPLPSRRSARKGDQLRKENVDDDAVEKEPFDDQPLVVEGHSIVPRRGTCYCPVGRDFINLMNVVGTLKKRLRLEKAQQRRDEQHLDNNKQRRKGKGGNQANSTTSPNQKIGAFEWVLENPFIQEKQAVSIPTSIASDSKKHWEKRILLDLSSNSPDSIAEYAGVCMKSFYVLHKRDVAVDDDGDLTCNGALPPKSSPVSVHGEHVPNTERSSPSPSQFIPMLTRRRLHHTSTFNAFKHHHALDSRSQQDLLPTKFILPFPQDHIRLLPPRETALLQIAGSTALRPDLIRAQRPWKEGSATKTPFTRNCLNVGESEREGGAASLELTSRPLCGVYLGPSAGMITNDLEGDAITLNSAVEMSAQLAKGMFASVPLVRGRDHQSVQAQGTLFPALGLAVTWKQHGLADSGCEYPNNDGERCGEMLDIIRVPDVGHLGTAPLGSAVMENTRTSPLDSSAAGKGVTLALDTWHCRSNTNNQSVVFSTSTLCSKSYLETEGAVGSSPVMASSATKLVWESNVVYPAGSKETKIFRNKAALASTTGCSSPVWMYECETKPRKRRGYSSVKGPSLRVTLSFHPSVLHFMTTNHSGGHYESTPPVVARTHEEATLFADNSIDEDRHTTCVLASTQYQLNVDKSPATHAPQPSCVSYHVDTSRGDLLLLCSPKDPIAYGIQGGSEMFIADARAPMISTSVDRGAVDHSVDASRRGHLLRLNTVVTCSQQRIAFSDASHSSQSTIVHTTDATRFTCLDGNNLPGDLHLEHDFVTQRGDGTVELWDTRMIGSTNAANSAVSVLWKETRNRKVRPLPPFSLCGDFIAASTCSDAPEIVILNKKTLTVVQEPILLPSLECPRCVAASNASPLAAGGSGGVKMKTPFKLLPLGPSEIRVATMRLGCHGLCESQSDVDEGLGTHLNSSELRSGNFVCVSDLCL